MKKLSKKHNKAAEVVTNLSIINALIEPMEEAVNNLPEGFNEVKEAFISFSEKHIELIQSELYNYIEK